MSVHWVGLARPEEIHPRIVWVALLLRISPNSYWVLTAPRKGPPPGAVDIAIRTCFSPLLLKLGWQGWPLFHPREHGWTSSVSADAKFYDRTKALIFDSEEDVQVATANEEQSPAPKERRNPTKPSFHFCKLPYTRTAERQTSETRWRRLSSCTPRTKP